MDPAIFMSKLTPRCKWPNLDYPPGFSFFSEGSGTTRPVAAALFTTWAAASEAIDLRAAVARFVPNELRCTAWSIRRLILRASFVDVLVRCSSFVRPPSV